MRRMIIALSMGLAFALSAPAFADEAGSAPTVAAMQVHADNPDLAASAAGAKFALVPLAAGPAVIMATADKPVTARPNNDGRTSSGLAPESAYTSAAFSAAASPARGGAVAGIA